MPNENIFEWGSAKLAWHPDHYSITLAHHLNLRAIHHLIRGLPEELADVFELRQGEIRVSVEYNEGPDEVPGTLTIEGPIEILEGGASALQTHLEEAARAARTKAERDRELDEQLFAQWRSSIT